MPRPGQVRPIADRLLDLVEESETGCWLYTGRVLRHGYGQIEVRQGVGRSSRKRVSAHRLSYETFVGPIPEGLTLDHLCRVRHCINPAHLEPVTRRENTLRGVGPSALNAVKTSCHRGHAFTPENTRWCADGSRRCYECQRELRRARRARVAA